MNAAGRGLAAAGCAMALLAGCSRSEPADDATSKRLPWEGVQLRLSVVDDPALVEAIGRVQGEWKAQTGAELSVQTMAEADLVRADRLEADAVICPSWLLGPLAQRGLVAPIPQAACDAPAARWMDIFELQRSDEAAWANQTMAVPLGSPVLVCYYRADLFERLGLTPPATWSDYHALAKLLSDRDKLGPGAPAEGAAWSGTIEPLGPGWAGLVLLARAAASVKHPDNYSALFDIQTMEPLVDSAPMVQALMYLVADAELGPPDALSLGLDAARARFWQGQSAMALAWPSAAAKLPGPPVQNLAVGIAALPGSKDVFNFDLGSWEPRPEGTATRVPLLGIAGRLGVVGRESKHAAAAVEMLLWLSGAAPGPPSAGSPATTLFRRSQIRRPTVWTEAPLSPAAAAAYAELVESTFQGEQWLFALRIPGRDEYLAALDNAVHNAVNRQATPAAALREAADKWREITRRRGLEQQRTAYLHRLGLEP